MLGFVVNVNKASIDIWQSLQLILQVLRDVVRTPQRCIAIDNHVDFHVVFWSRVANATAVNGFDVFAECHSLKFVKRESISVIAQGIA